MPTLFPPSRRATVLAAALLVALAVSGCAFKNPFASKNPLIDDEPMPVAAARTEAPPAKPVLPKPVLVVKPAEQSKPAENAEPNVEATLPAATPAPEPVQTQPAAPPAPELKPAASEPAAVPASAVLPAPEPDFARISDPGRPAPTGWARWLGIFKPYKMNIQQGNFVSQDMAAKVHIGMTKEQVRFLLGTPLLTDVFHANRWDYLFRLQKPNGELTANRMAIYFSDNRIERIQSSELPSESEYLTHIAGDAEPAKPKTPPAASSQPSTQP